MQKENTKIVIVEDNLLLAENIGTYLTLKNIDTIIFNDIESLEKEIKNINFDILVLDINLPGKSGLEYLKEFRQSGDKRYVIILTSRNTGKDIVTGLDFGADDYISKPFNFEEFTARINTITRRLNKFDNNIIKIFLEEEKSEIQINLEQKLVKKDGNNIFLSALEYKLLEFLLKNRSKIVDRSKIYEEVWGEFDRYYFSRTVDVYIGYLRKKLGIELIKTKIGDGYVIY